jgi:hypothetical protein
MSLQIEPIARITSIIYAGFGFLFWIAYCLRTTVDYITLPVGIIAPLLNLNVNLNFHRSASVFANLGFLLGSIACYALTGWLTAAAAVGCFNLVARFKGGISADFALLRPKQERQTASVQ